MTNLAAAVLDPLLAVPSAPRITYYDDATGERIELSTVTLANWAAKTGNLLRDELGAGPGSRVAMLLPAHWQTLGVLLGVWFVGAEVVLGQDDCDIACCTAERLDEAEARSGEVVALSLDAFGRPIADLPFGITDYATSVRAHGDQIVAERSPGPALDGRSVTEVLSLAQDSASAAGWTADSRVLSAAPWDTAERVVDHVLAVLTAGGSLVQVAHPDPDAQARRRAAEKVTAELA
ncbi:TIGR03089 family protein [Mycolicibacterium madagascariense]|uniref:TIGR03089 family protein n=1 Tax=Mycolicibacterium madagascariense TaxID=212765 RepID=UPI0015D1DAC3|nr:TIGR03089 family protein [Mycolicibacterium madagascariense]MCV7015762.1 TIGR03089 family protein [Mycolicibacterium madagascariense]